MRSMIFITSALAVLASTSSAEAQRRSTDIAVSRGEFAIAPFGGYLLSQRFIDGPLGTSLDVASAPMYGIQISLPLAPSASLIGTIAHASGDLKAASRL